MPRSACGSGSSGESTDPGDRTPDAAISGTTATVIVASPEAAPPAQAPRTARLDEHSLARAALTYLAEPADPALGALLEICEPTEILAAIKADMLPGIGPGCGDSPASRKALERALARWRARLPGLPGDADIAAFGRDGIRLACPGDPQWPDRQSVSVVGSRAATGYGAHIACELAADLGDRGWAIASGGA
jgi:DNA processing protein